MYIPKHFREEDQKKIIDFIKANNFGIILSNDGKEMVGTHIPFILVEHEHALQTHANSARFYLKSHLAAANPQLEHWKKHNDCLIIFNGPHAYISPSLYESKKNVPTWNFIAIHVYATLKVIDDFETKKDLLVESINSFEPAYMNQWNTLDVKYRDKLINGMTGLEMQVTKVEAKYKLSQNKPESTRKNVADHFKEDGHELGDYM